MPEISGMIQEFLEGSIKTIGGKQPVIQSKTITENGTYNTPSGVDGFNPVVVNVPSQEPNIQERVFASNGTFNPPEGVDGYAPVIIDVPMKEEITLNVTTNGTYTPSEGRVYNNVIVNVPSDETVIESKTITENGTYTPESGVDGFSPVVVNVPLPQNAYLLKSVANLPQAIATFKDGADAPMKSLKVAIEPQQEGSGDPSPTNIRPISGWDEAVVTVADDAESPTTSHEYTIDLDGTRYGGELDAVNGVLTVDRVTISGRVTSLSSNTYSNIVYGTIEKPNDSKNKGNTEVHNLISSMYPVSPIITGWDNADNIEKMFVGASYTQFWIGFPLGTTLQDAQTETNNNVLCYELATPLTIQLTPTAVKSLLGVNNIWADTGDITDAEYFSKSISNTN